MVKKKRKKRGSSLCNLKTSVHQYVNLRISCTGDHLGDCAGVERIDSSTGCLKVELTEAEDHLQTAEGFEDSFGSDSL